MTQPTSPIAATARTIAHQLTDRYGSHLPADVEAALHTTDQRPQHYLDPISLGGLIVAVAALAWTTYQDLKKTTPQPPPAVITRTIRLQLTTDTTELPAGERDRIIDLTVTETIQTAQNLPQNPDLPTPNNGLDIP